MYKCDFFSHNHLFPPFPTYFHLFPHLFEFFFEKFDYPTFLSMFFIDGVKGQNQKMMKNRLKLMKNMVKLMKNMVTLKFEFF